MSLPFAMPDVARRVDTLTQLWERASTAVAHPAGCACNGYDPVSLDPRIVEDNILYYLQTRYGEAGEARLLAVIEGRRGALMAPAGHERFEDWLQRAAGLPDAEREMLLDDLTRVLSSFEPLDRGGFACY